MFRRATARLAVTGRFAYPALSRCDGNDLGDAARGRLQLGFGARGSAALLDDYQYRFPGEFAFEQFLGLVLIFTANGSRALAKRSTTVIFPAAEAICSIKPLLTMSCPFRDGRATRARCLIFSSIFVS